MKAIEKELQKIEKTEERKDFAVELKGGRKEIHHMKRDTAGANSRFLLQTGLNGIVI